MSSKVISSPSIPLDAYIGQAVLQDRLITPEQLRQALDEQSRERERGGPSPLPLAAILVAKGWVTDRQIFALLEAYAAKAGEGKPDPNLLGQILVRGGMTTEAQVQEALLAQEEARRTGHPAVRRIGEILVDKGYATSEAVTTALGHQQKSILSCPACGLRSNVVSFDPSQSYPCKRCGGALRPLSRFDNVQVGASTVLGLTSEIQTPQPTYAPPFGKYVILREVGRGGMAIVYEALDGGLGRRVALKLMLSKEYASAAEALMESERFLREAHLAAQLPKHPNVVSVYDAGVLDGKRYIAMEFIDGVAMSEWWKREDLTVRRKVEVLKDVALAVHHAHEHGVIHRDLKPENVLVDREERPHVTDFGLAKLTGHAQGTLTLAGMVVGTPGYMSPEQAQGLKTADHRMDVYALGVLLFEIMTSQRPFDGDSAMEILLKASRSAPPRPTDLMREGTNPVLYVDLEKVCLKALSKTAAERYPDAAAFAADLERWLGGHPVEAKVPGEPSGSPAMRVGVGVAVAAALAIGFLPLILSRNPAPAPVAPLAPSPGGGSGLVKVSARAQWTDTGRDVREGETLEISATGTWRSPLASPKFPFDTSPTMALIARVGEKGDPWVLPDSRAVTMPATGRLYLGPNDTSLEDNDGELTVTLRDRAGPVEEIRVGLERFTRVANQMMYYHPGPGELWLCTAGSAEARVDVPRAGEYRVVLAASGNEVKGELPRFTLWVDEEPVGTSPQVKATRSDYGFTAKLSAGRHAVRVEYLNDYYDEVTKLDRNFCIHGLRLRYLR